jgi:hypothetical protein
VGGGAGERHRLAQQFVADEARGRHLLERGERQLQLSLTNFLQQRGRAGLSQPDVDPGMVGMEAGQQGGQPDGDQRLHDPERERPALEALHVRHGLAGARRRRRHPPRLG